MPHKNTSSTGKSGAAAVEAGETPASPCLVVAIGASAGGQEALEQLFTAMPTDCGVSFVVAMHLPPGGPSFLAGMLGRYTTMEVVTAAEGMPLLPNRVQVIPAGVELTIGNDRLLLHLEGPAEPNKAHHPIDRLFRSLAEEKAGQAIAVVLSGFGTDGTEGVRAIRAAGGLVIVQEPASAGSPAMPQSAIATGAADLILPAEEIPLKIAETARTACSLAAHACRPATLEEELRTILSIVKAKTGHDFSSYKTNTVMRRIERRMAVNDAAGIGKYIALLRESTQEAHALCQDILIGVTSFFRDPEAFDTMRREIVPRLFADRDPDDPVRIWHACCATGEEVYSMAMLVREYLDEHRLAAKVQLFATDIDEVAIAQARAGLYDDDIGAVLGEERLKTFFTRNENHWQVAKSLREMIVFAHHSLIKDPPFSRLDLLVCRNFLIYLNPDMQKRLISLFHQVLKPGGVLFLGSAESVGHHSGLFDTVDKKWKIFVRREGVHRSETPFPLATSVRLPGKQRPGRPAGAREPAPEAMAERFLVERYAPPGVVINDKYEVIHTSSRMGRFLEVPVGEQTRDILKMAREELRPALRAAIYKGFVEQDEVIFRSVKVGDAGDESTVNILVKPLQAAPSAGKLLMVVFEPASPPPALPAPSGGEEAAPGVETSREVLMRQLEEQLHITHEQLQATTEQLETSNEGFLSASEELMSINEEFQSANEELQSTNEELETSKEELQALNEELVTVNAELQGKVEELHQTNSNMENLLASSEIATLFLDRRLHLRGFTPAAAAVFNLIPTDAGRPFRHFAGRIDWPTFTRDVETVLAGRPFAEREVTTLNSERCYLKRLYPYRLPEGGIDGIVVTLIDITERKRMDESLLRSEERYRGLVETAQIAIFINRNSRIEYANPAAVKLFGADTSDTVIGRSPYDFVHPDFHATMAKRVRVLLRGGSVPLLETRVVRPDGSERFVETTAMAFADRQGMAVQIMMHDITERKRAEEELQRARDEWELTFNSVPDLIAIIDHHHRVMRVNRAMAKLLGRTPQECIGLHCYEAIHGSSLPPGFCPHARTLVDGGEHQEEVHEENLGGDYLVSTTPMLDQEGHMIGSVHVARNISERKRAEEALRQAKDAAEAATRTKSRFLANMSHELRTPMTGVLGMLDHVLSGTLEAEQREFIGMAHSSAHSLLRILNDILDLTKIEAGKLFLDPKPFPIRECVRNTVNILLPAARSKGIDLTFTVADAVPEMVNGDQTRLSQVLTNLAGNAVKFTEKGAVEISVTTDGSAPADKHSVTFAVADTGIGIPDAKKGLIFREFTQVDDSHSRSYGGTGLGLAISKEIVERMGGEITVTSREGQGSCFFCRIPLGESETEPDAAPAPGVPAQAEAPSPAETKASPRLLLAEDDQTIRKVLGVMLKRTNYETDMAENGQRAVEMWENGNYDLILMDVQMPHMNGFEATGTIRRKERSRGGHIPIIAMTAHALKEDEERCRAAGMDAYISKPIDFNACRQLIGETLEKSAAFPDRGTGAQDQRLRPGDDAA